MLKFYTLKYKICQRFVSLLQLIKMRRMRKSSISEMLEIYFKHTNIDEINRVWDSTSIFDVIDSPSMEEFIQSTDCFFEIKSDPPEIDKQNFDNTVQSPNFTSDFLFI